MFDPGQVRGTRVPRVGRTQENHQEQAGIHETALRLRLSVRKMIADMDSSATTCDRAFRPANNTGPTPASAPVADTVRCREALAGLEAHRPVLHVEVVCQFALAGELQVSGSTPLSNPPTTRRPGPTAARSGRMSHLHLSSHSQPSRRPRPCTARPARTRSRRRSAP